MASWRFRQAAEAPIPRTFVTDSLGCQASKGGSDACPGPWTRGEEAKEELFASSDVESVLLRALCVDGLEEEWLAGDAASL